MSIINKVNQEYTIIERTYQTTSTFADFNAHLIMTGSYSLTLMGMGLSQCILGKGTYKVMASSSSHLRSTKEGHGKRYGKNISTSTSSDQEELIYQK